MSHAFLDLKPDLTWNLPLWLFIRNQEKVHSLFIPVEKCRYCVKFVICCICFSFGNPVVDQQQSFTDFV